MGVEAKWAQADIERTLSAYNSAEGDIHTDHQL